MLALALQLPEPAAQAAALDLREAGIQLTYLAACVLFILGLSSLTKPARAQRGMQFAALGMLLAIVGTLLHRDIVRFEWIAGGLLLGTAIGYPLGMFVPMMASSIPSAANCIPRCAFAGLVREERPRMKRTQAAR